MRCEHGHDTYQRDDGHDDYGRPPPSGRRQQEERADSEPADVQQAAEEVVPLVGRIRPARQLSDRLECGRHPEHGQGQRPDRLVRLPAGEVLPSPDPREGSADHELINEIGRESILRDKLEPVQKRYDFIIIDCPPSLDLIVINALVAADEVLVPLQAEFLALKGMQELLITMERVKRRLNPRLELIGILPTLYKSRALHSQEVLAAVREKYGDKVYDFGVTDSIRFAETPLAGQSILQYAKDSDGARSYRALAARVMENHRD